MYQATMVLDMNSGEIHKNIYFHLFNNLMFYFLIYKTGFKLHFNITFKMIYTEYSIWICVPWLVV